MPLAVTSMVLYCFEIIFYTFHLSVLILMIVQQKTVFKGAYFNIFRAVLAADLICFACQTITQKLPLIPFFIDFYKSSVYMVLIAYDLLSCVYVMQFFGHLFLALNRFTLIWFPLKHNKIWEKQWYTIVIFLFAFMNVSWRIHEIIFYNFAEDGSFSVNYVNSHVAPTNFITTTVLYLSSTFLAGFLNFFAFLKFLFHKQNNGSLNVNEKHLLLVSLAIFTTQFLRASYNIGNLLFKSSPIASFLSSILPLLIDIFAWSGSISLMFLSSSTRKAYKSYYLCKSNIQKHSTGNFTVMYPSTKP